MFTHESLIYFTYEYDLRLHPFPYKCLKLFLLYN